MGERILLQVEPEEPGRPKDDSLDRVRALPGLRQLYRCHCGLLRVQSIPCEQCDEAAVRYLSWLRDLQRTRAR